MSTELPTPARVLAVGAHPDDIEFGCGATLATWTRAGCPMAIVPRSRRGAEISKLV